MEINNNQGVNQALNGGLDTTAQNGQITGTTAAQNADAERAASALGTVFFSIIQRVLADSRENSGTGA